MTTTEVAKPTVGSDDWMVLVAAMTRTAMIGEYSERSCIAACRIGMAVLDYFGVEARPFACTASVLTSDAAHWHAANGWEQHAPTGYSVGLGGDGSGRVNRASGEWSGHLVLRLPGLDRLMDIAIDQAHRPEKGLIVLRPLVATVMDAWPEYADQVSVFERVEDGVFILYRALPAEVAGSYGVAADWRGNESKRHRVAGHAIREVRSATAP